MTVQTRPEDEKSGRDRGRRDDEWGDLCSRAKEMAGEGEYPARAYKLMITELLGGLKAINSIKTLTEKVAIQAAARNTQQKPTWASIVGQAGPNHQLS